MTQTDSLPSAGSWPSWAKQTADRILKGQPTPTDLLWTDRSLVLRQAGLTPDPWQAEVLRSSSSRILMLASRQTGKSLVAGALALCEALLVPRSLVLLL